MSRKQEYTAALLIRPAGLFVASVGYSLSLLATIFAVLTSSSSGAEPIIDIRDVAPTTSTRSSESSVNSHRSSLRDKAAARVSSPKRLKSPPRRELVVDVKGKAKADPEIELTQSPFEMTSEFAPLSIDAPPHAVHFQSSISNPISEIPTISISPAPTRNRMSTHSDISRASTDVNTLSSTDSTAASSSTPERRGRRRSRFSKIVHLFTDNRGSSSASATLIASPPLPTRSISMTPKRKRRSSALMMRVASCPVLHHSHHSHTHSADQAAAPPQSPCVKKEKEKKEPAPRRRTQPYAAPYFIPPPDSADVEEPFPRRRPSRRRTSAV
ncbi:hypothetical protein C8R43DRAFT_318046 [Mycena crocata]|nr:hypothetical protein C8R43DRAFT_318046 [Mycena crocata]